MKARALLILSSISAATLAQAAVDLRGSYGRYRPNGELVLRISPEPDVDAVRVFSEPSHRLLAVLVDDDWAQTPDGQQVLASAPKTARVAATIHSARAHVEGWTQPPPPASDTAVVVYARSADGAERPILSSHSDIHHDFTLTALR